MPVSHNINKLWQSLAGKSKSKPVNIVAQRFRQAFHDHGVEAAQIPRLLPQVKLDDLKSDETLLEVLTPEVIDQAAHLFGIRAEWLEGVDDNIYEYLHCYKQPELFFELLATLRSRANYDFSFFPLRVLSSTKNLDGKDDRQQLLVPILLEKVGELGDEWIYRYHIFNDGFDWGYAPSRIQLKAIVRLLYTVLKFHTPLFVVSSVELQNVLDRKKIPRGFVKGCLLTDPSIEDFAMTREESRIAMEVDELPEVLKYIKDHKLESLITVERPQASTAPNEPVSEPDVTAEPQVQAEPPKSGKRADNDQELWAPVRAVAGALWGEKGDTLSIAEAVRRIKRMPHLKASNFTESAIRKHIADLAPLNVRGKSGRKPKKPS